MLTPSRQDLEGCAEGLIPQMNRLSEVHDTVCGERERRQEKLQGLHARLSELCSSIGQPMPDGMEEVSLLLTEERISAFDAAVATAQHRKVRLPSRPPRRPAAPPRMVTARLSVLWCSKSA